MSSISSNIANLLGVGQGIDSASLVSQLVAATRDPREQALSEQESTNKARISALGSAKSALDTFAKALQDTLQSQAFAGEPTSANLSIVGASMLDGGIPTGLPAQVEVRQLAYAQTSISAAYEDADAPIGTGSLTLSTAKGDFKIDISATGGDSLSDIADAINAAKSGVTANVVTDVNGSRLMLKGESGEANAFTLTADAGASAGLTDLAAGLTVAQTASDSVVVIDGVEMHNASNQIDNAIPYTRLDIVKAEPGTIVTIDTSEPLTTVSGLLQDFVSAYNDLRDALNSATAPGADSTTAGPLAGDAGVRALTQALAGITQTQLASTGTYKTLSDIGIETQRDGTLKLNSDRLNDVLAADPEAIQDLLNPQTPDDDHIGLSGALTAIQENMEGKGGALTVAVDRYNNVAEALADKREKLDSDMESYEARLEKQFGGMDTKLAQLKSIQSYLDQQIAAWNAQSDD